MDAHLCRKQLHDLNDPGFDYFRAGKIETAIQIKPVSRMPVFKEVDRS
jgi:hypothetical protein